MAPQFTQLSALNKFKTSWRIKVRVTRMWPTVGSDRVTVKGYNLILLDDDYYHMHAFVYPDQWRTLEDTVREGNIYRIQNFSVREAVGSLKPVSTRMAIIFSNTTVVEEVLEEDFMIERHKFEFVALGDLPNILPDRAEKMDEDKKEVQPEFAMDILGAVELIEKVKIIPTKFGPRKILKFQITDGSVSHRVTVWGESADYVSQLMEEELNHPMIMILSSTKVTNFRGIINISALPSTKIYINLEHIDVLAMRHRISELHYEVLEYTDDANTASEVEEIEKISLKMLTSLTDRAYIKKEIVCKAKVDKIEVNEKWWYDCCNTCQEEVTKKGGDYVCPICPLPMPFADKRFKVLLLAQDDTNVCNIILLDRAVRRIVGAKASTIVSSMNKAQLMPDVLLQIRGNEYHFVILISEANIINGTSLYYATDIFNVSSSPCASFSGNSMLNIPTVSLEDTPSSSKTMANPVQTPGTEKSSNKDIADVTKNLLNDEEMSAMKNKKIKLEE